jgi:dihydrofolate reductase
MRRIVVTEFISVDGVMEGPGGEPGYKHSGWVGKFHGPESIEYKLDEVKTHDALLLGRKTYEGFAAAWPQRDGEFADRMNAMQKYVVSTTLDPGLEWENSELISENVPEEIAKLKEGEGGDILVGGSRTLVQTLKEHDLVDEYRLMTFPIVLGSGARLFGESDDATTLKLTGAKPVDSGTVILTYEPAYAAA